MLGNSNLVRLIVLEKCRFPAGEKALTGHCVNIWTVPMRQSARETDFVQLLRVTDEDWRRIVGFSSHFSKWGKSLMLRRLFVRGLCIALDYSSLIIYSVLWWSDLKDLWILVVLSAAFIINWWLVMLVHTTGIYSLTTSKNPKQTWPRLTLAEGEWSNRKNDFLIGFEKISDAYSI